MLLIQVAQLIVWEKMLEADKDCFNDRKVLDAAIVEWEKKLLNKDFKTHGQA